MIDETGKVTFNEQENAEISKIIGDRLAREGVYDLKEIAESLKEFGYTGTPAEVKQAIKEQAEYNRTQTAEAQKRAEIDALKEQARNEGTSPELLAEIKALKADLTEIKGERTAQKQAEAQKIEFDNLRNTQIDEFRTNEKTKAIDLEKLNENPKFVKFLSNTKYSKGKDYLVKVYEDFVDLIGGAETEAIAKLKANADRSTSSGRNAGDASSGTYGLNARQMALADENGMTYKQYHDNLKLITK